MNLPDGYCERLRGAWLGRVSGCQLGKPVELLSMRQGQAALERYLDRAGSRPLRNYIPFVESEDSEHVVRRWCRQSLRRAEADDDINYCVLALQMLERFGSRLTTEDVARSWLHSLPPAMTFTAERAALKVLLDRGDEMFAYGADPGFDLAECSDNGYNTWIGAQIRADLYGWVCPGRPALAARLVRQDAELSHRGDGVDGAVLIAAWGSAMSAEPTLESALDRALEELPEESGCREAVALGRSVVGDRAGGKAVHDRYVGLSPVATVNNLALVVWSLLSHPEDFGAAIGEAVAAGLDTDCNGATVGGLWGLQGLPIPERWTDPWQGRVSVTLAGIGEQRVDDLIARTVALTEALAGES
ncbi:MAG: ADP-ribosylglycohydrolase family protein [Acidobacteriota bacterium]